jgi:DNA-directed RNA polymerase specialized sigma24 family protein
VSFRDPLPEHELDRLSDEALIAYVAAMRDRGHREAAATGLAVLVYGHWVNVRRRVARRVHEADVDDVTGEVMTSAIRSAFDGTSEGEFVVWLGTIVKRRIADFHRKRERRLATDSLQVIAESGHEPATDGEIDRSGYLEVQALIVELLDERSAEHRCVIELMVFEDLPASAALEAVEGLSEANAYKIVSRFRADLRRRLAERDTDPDPA